MLEVNFGAATPSGKFNLQTSTSKLLLKARLPKGLNSFLEDFELACADTIVSATRYSENKGTKELFVKMNLQDLAEIAAMNEGYINVKTLGTSDFWDVRFTVELSNAGAVKLSQKDFITMQFAGMEKFTFVEIFSMGAAVEFDEHLKISPVSCAAGAQIKFNCLSHYGVVVPSTLSKLTITYINGITQEIDGKELSLIAPDVNEIVYNIDGAVIPYNKWRFFPIPTADRAVVTLSQVGFAYLLSSKNYE